MPTVENKGSPARLASRDSNEPPLCNDLDDVLGFQATKASTASPPRTLVFPSRPRAARKGSVTSLAPSLASSRSSALMTSSPLAMLPPPDLSIDPLFEDDEDPFAASSSLSAGLTRPRGARADYSRGLPPSAQWLLLSTPPPLPCKDAGAGRRDSVVNGGGDGKADEGGDLMGKLRKLTSKSAYVRRTSTTITLASPLSSPVAPSPASLAPDSPPTSRLNSRTDSFSVPRSWEEYVNL
jgi:hypothetical protein